MTYGLVKSCTEQNTTGGERRGGAEKVLPVQVIVVIYH